MPLPPNEVPLDTEGRAQVDEIMLLYEGVRERWEAILNNDPFYELLRKMGHRIPRRRRGRYHPDHATQVCIWMLADLYVGVTGLMPGTATNQFNEETPSRFQRFCKTHWPPGAEMPSRHTFRKILDFWKEDRIRAI